MGFESGIGNLGVLSLLIGLVVGSFLNVVISRSGSQKSPLAGRSNCDHCRRTLTWWELIPLFSFLVFRGRCRTCGAPIGWSTFLIELVSGIGTALILSRLGLTLSSSMYLIAFWIGLVIFAIDLVHYLIPDGAVVGLTLVALLQSLTEPALFETSLLGAIVSMGVLGFLVLITRGRGMGFGDVKLALPLGLLLGWPGAGIGLFLAFILGSLVGIGLLLSHQRGWRDAVPFAPFLLTGTLLAMIWGNELMMWYLGLARL